MIYVLIGLQLGAWLWFFDQPRDFFPDYVIALLAPYVIIGVAKGFYDNVANCLRLARRKLLG